MSIFSRSTAAPDRNRFTTEYKEVNMKVGILGSGDVAKALAAGFIRYGHDVVLGTRDQAKLAGWAGQHQPIWRESPSLTPPTRSPMPRPSMAF
jgi:hypothetical protein